MRVINTYQCEICGRIYETQVLALDCEDHHGVPQDIIQRSYKYEEMMKGYPIDIDVIMTNGKVCEYKFSQEKSL